MIVKIDDTNLHIIAQAIREKNGTETTYKPSEMADAIRAIESGSTDEVASYFVSNRSGLTSYTFPEGIITVDSYAFAECAELELAALPSTITHIHSCAFQNCKKLALTSLPNSIVAISLNAFYGCSALNLTSLPEGLTEIATSCFSRCTGLTQMTIPASVSYVWTSAFSMCTNLATVTFTGKPEEIADNAFSSCSKLTTINVPWASGAVVGAPWGATNATVNYNYVPPLDFTIDGIVYHCEPNTSWYNWAGSKYNTDNRFVRYNDGTYWRIKDGAQEGTPDVYQNGTRIIANSIILANTAYYTEGNEP